MNDVLSLFSQQKNLEPTAIAPSLTLNLVVLATSLLFSFRLGRGSDSRWDDLIN